MQCLWGRTCVDLYVYFTNTRHFSFILYYSHSACQVRNIYLKRSTRICIQSWQKGLTSWHHARCTLSCVYMMSDFCVNWFSLFRLQHECGCCFWHSWCGTGRDIMWTVKCGILSWRAGWCHDENISFLFQLFGLNIFLLKWKGLRVA